MEIYSLYEINTLIKKVLARNFNTTYLVTAEINQITRSSAGHAYLDLVEKDNDLGTTTAQARATIWANVFRTLNPYFEQVTGRKLEKGIKILIETTIQYSEVYGLSFSVRGIMPEYTLGEIEMQRRQTIERLKKEGIYEKNKQKKLPMLIKNIAILSSENAAGYGDFVNQLTFNPYGYKFNTILFNTPVQGIEAEKNIPLQLYKIAKLSQYFDCVAIIRGGGSKGDLSCFDNYDVCAAICNFPLPVITGIGHDRDVSIADEVANKHFKTPTAVAQFIIDTAANCDSMLSEQIEIIKGATTNALKRAEQKNLETIYRVKSSLSNFITKKRHSMETSTLKIYNSMKSVANQKLHQVDNIALKAELKDPINILKKGYAYTMQNGEVINSTQNIAIGSNLSIIYYDGKAEAEIKKITK